LKKILEVYILGFKVFLKEQDAQLSQRDRAELFSLGVTAEALPRLKIGGFARTEAGWPTISGRRGRPHQPFFFSEN